MASFSSSVISTFGCVAARSPRSESACCMLSPTIFSTISAMADLP